MTSQREEQIFVEHSEVTPEAILFLVDPRASLCHNRITIIDTATISKRGPGFSHNKIGNIVTMPYLCTTAPHEINSFPINTYQLLYFHPDGLGQNL